MKTKTKTKLTVDEFLTQIGVKPYSNEYFAAQSVVKMYGDCLPDTVETVDERCLNAVAHRDPIKAERLLPLLKIIGKYNDFDPEKAAQQIAQYFGKDAKCMIGREGSPCIYVRPEEMIPLDRDKVLSCDEFHFDPALIAFRIWWD